MQCLTFPAWSRTLNSQYVTVLGMVLVAVTFTCWVPAGKSNGGLGATDVGFVATVPFLMTIAKTSAIPLPVSNTVTSCCFGGPAINRLTKQVGGLVSGTQFPIGSGMLLAAGRSVTVPSGEGIPSGHKRRC
jgi:hypothetical protein